MKCGDRGGGAHVGEYVGNVVAFAPDGKTLASGGGETVTLWDVATGKELRHWDKHQEYNTRLLFAAGGKLLASSDSQSTLIWDTGSGTELRQLKSSNHALAFAPCHIGPHVLA
jgi:WD40 repeat protein